MIFHSYSQVFTFTFNFRKLDHNRRDLGTNNPKAKCKKDNPWSLSKVTFHHFDLSPDFPVSGGSDSGADPGQGVNRAGSDLSQLCGDEDWHRCWGERPSCQTWHHGELPISSVISNTIHTSCLFLQKQFASSSQFFPLFRNILGFFLNNCSSTDFQCSTPSTSQWRRMSWRERRGRRWASSS